MPSRKQVDHIYNPSSSLQLPIAKAALAAYLLGLITRTRPGRQSHWSRTQGRLPSRWPCTPPGRRASGRAHTCRSPCLTRRRQARQVKVGVVRRAAVRHRSRDAIGQHGRRRGVVQHQPAVGGAVAGAQRRAGRRRWQRLHELRRRCRSRRSCGRSRGGGCGRRCRRSCRRSCGRCSRRCSRRSCRGLSGSCGRHRSWRGRLGFGGSCRRRGRRGLGRSCCRRLCGCRSGSLRWSLGWALVGARVGASRLGASRLGASRLRAGRCRQRHEVEVRSWSSSAEDSCRNDLVQRRLWLVPIVS